MPLVPAAIPFLIAFAILLLVLSIVLVAWNAIAFSLIAHSGTFGNIEINGIRICGRVEKNNRLLLREEIREVNVIFQPPFCSAEVILNSGESVMTFTEHSSNLESALEKYNIPFARKQRGE